jgi:WD40 repeat protein
MMCRLFIKNIIYFKLYHGIMKMRAAVTTAFLLSGPLPIRPLCDLVHDYGNALDGNCLHVLAGYPHGVRVLAVIPGGKLAAADNTVIHIWDTASGERIHTLKGHTKVIWNLVVMQGQFLVSAAMDKTMCIWDTVSGLRVTKVNSPFGYSDLVVWGGYLAVAAGPTVRLWDQETRSWMRTLEGHTSTVTVLAGTPSMLASGSRDYTVRVWDESGELQRLKGHTHIVYGLVPLPDDRLASSASDCTVRVWDMLTGMCLFTLEGHTRSVDKLAFNGKLISGSHDKTLRVWDITNGACLYTLAGYGQGVRGMAVMPGGMLASCSADKKVQVWDLEAGVLFRELFGHEDELMAVIALPDGQIASGSLDRTVRVWG